jgi:hypothetical protein
MKTNAYLEKCFSKDPSIVFRKVSDEFILVPIKQKASDVESIYTMNDVASRIWELINGKRSLEDIKAVIIKEFEVSPEEAEKDLVEFSKQLEKIGAVRLV